MLTPKWDARFLLASAFFAGFSKDPSTKCGCVLATSRRRIVGFGYNGRPQGVDDSPLILGDRPRKLLSTVHAEINALTFYAGDCADVTAYVWQPSCEGPSCAPCAGPMVNRGIRRLVYAGRGGATAFPIAWRDSYQEANRMFAEVGAEVLHYARADLAILSEMDFAELLEMVADVQTR